MAEWVLRGWDRPDGKIAVLELRNKRGRDGKIVEERFEADPVRTRALTAWSRLWKAWAASEKPAREAMRVFEALYALYSAIEQRPREIVVDLQQLRFMDSTKISTLVITRRAAHEHGLRSPSPNGCPSRGVAQVAAR